MIKVCDLLIDIIENNLYEFVNCCFNLKKPYSEETNIDNYKQSIFKASIDILEKLKRKDYITQSNKVIIAYYTNVHENMLETKQEKECLFVEAYNIKTIKEDMQSFVEQIDNNTLLDVNNINEEFKKFDVCQDFINRIVPINSDSLFLCDWKDIFNYYIFESNLKLIGKLKFASIIFCEMTYCGNSQEEIDTFLNDLDDTINNLEQINEFEGFKDLDEIRELFDKCHEDEELIYNIMNKDVINEILAQYYAFTYILKNLN